VDWCKLRSSCTVKRKRGNAITVALDSFGHIPHEENERPQADAKRWKMTEDAENHQVRILDDMDAHISSLDETLRQLTESLVVEGLSKSLDAIAERLNRTHMPKSRGSKTLTVP
jgi:hypothetical protein